MSRELRGTWHAISNGDARDSEWCLEGGRTDGVTDKGQVLEVTTGTPVEGRPAQPDIPRSHC